MNIDTLQLINKSSTSKIIFNLLANSKPISNETNIESFKVFLKKRGFQLNEDDFYRVFDDLEDCGAGAFSTIQPEKFVWRFNLKDISEQIMYPNKKVTIRSEVNESSNKGNETRTDLKVVPNQKEESMNEVKKLKKSGRGRPKGAKNKPKETLAIVTKIAPPILNRVPMEKEMAFLFKTESGKKFVLTLQEATSLIKQVEEIREIMA